MFNRKKHKQTQLDKLCEIEGCPREAKSLGFCTNHYQIMKYHTDDKYRENVKKINRSAVGKFMNKRMLKDPDWNKKRQKNYRKNHPKKYNYMLARYYFRKLSPVDKLKLIDEVRL